MLIPNWSNPHEVRSQLPLMVDDSHHLYRHCSWKTIDDVDFIWSLHAFILSHIGTVIITLKACSVDIGVFGFSNFHLLRVDSFSMGFSSCLRDLIIYEVIRFSNYCGRKLSSSAGMRFFFSIISISQFCLLSSSYLLLSIFIHNTSKIMKTWLKTNWRKIVGISTWNCSIGPTCPIWSN